MPVRSAISPKRSPLPGNAAAWKDDLGSARGDKVAGVAFVALAHDPFARHRNRGLSNFCTRSELLVGEIGKQVETPNQLARIEAQVKARPRLALRSSRCP